MPRVREFKFRAGFSKSRTQKMSQLVRLESEHCVALEHTTEVLDVVWEIAPHVTPESVASIIAAEAASIAIEPAKLASMFFLRHPKS